VEDRCSSRLYLELGDTTPEGCAVRASTLAACPGVQRVSWWENCAPGRTDLRMRFRDGLTLVLVEADEGYEPPSTSPGASQAHCFRRHARPSQGILTGKPTLGLLLVWIGPRAPELASDLRDWGDFVHLRHIAAAAVPGFTQISVYENEAQTEPQYMHLYEFDNPDAEGTFSKMTGMVAPRLGGADSAAYGEWADLRAAGGRLFYCNTFRRAGERTTADRAAAPTLSG
jgi:hypothetical protein